MNGGHRYRSGRPIFSATRLTEEIYLRSALAIWTALAPSVTISINNFCSASVHCRGFSHLIIGSAHSETQNELEYEEARQVR